jgi:hypothetical protein
MKQTFETKGFIHAKLTSIRRGGRTVFDWVIEDEKNACDSCLICNHYKYNHDNYKKNAGKFVHICMVNLTNDPEGFIDITEPLKANLNTACKESFLRRQLG